MILAIGEILFDIFPEYKRLGGAPFNFAVHLKNFGYDIRFISGVGFDDDGKEILGHIKRAGFDPDYIQINDHSTGKVIVSLDKYGVPEYNILTDTAYDHISYNDKIRDLQDRMPEVIYVGTLIQRTENGYRTIRKILEKNDKTVCFYDVNLRPECYNTDIIESTLKHTTILKLNQEELFLIKNMLRINGNESEFIQNVFERYPVEMITITRGENGSSIITRDTRNSDYASNSVYAGSNKNIIDTVGAGDAFASIVAIGYLQSWEISKINILASEFASVICGIKGAIPEDKEIYNRFKLKF